MKTQTKALERFLRRLHVRLVMVRALERAGLCAAVAGAMVLTGSIVLMCRGEDALALSSAALLAGALAGLAWGLWRRPPLVDAALEADRQLDLADLLATAWSARDLEDPWAGAVIAMAQQRCAGLDPSRIALSRYGSRAWGGIGLSAALVLTIGLTSNLLSREHALAREGSSQALLSPPADAVHPSTPQDHDPALRSASAPRPAGQERGDEESSTESRDYDDPDASASARATDAAPNKTGDHRREAPAAGQSQSSSQEPRQRFEMPPGDAVGRRSDNSASQTAGGGQANTDRGGDRQFAGGGMNASAANERAHSAAEPDMSGPSAADRASAMQQIQSGKIPSDARDVVEEYFRH